MTANIAAERVVAGLVTTDVARLARAAESVLGGSRLDSDASAHLFAALGEVPLRVTRAVHDGQLDLAAATAAVDRSLALQQHVVARVQQLRSTGFARVVEVVDAVSRGTSAADLLAAAPSALCEACGFRRALISRVEGPGWVPRVLHSTSGDGDGLAGLLTGLQIPLKPGLVETQVVRRRAAALVPDADHDPRTYRPLVEQGGVSAYVVAPVVVGDRVVGLVHADRPASGVLTEADRDQVQLFADRFGRAYERAVLAEGVARQRESLRRALADSDRPCDELVAREATVVRFTPTVRTYAEPRRDAGLTPREREVLVLLAGGATNAQIASQLVVSESTAAWHVKRILAKLGAANRAEAAFLHLRGGRAG